MLGRIALAVALAASAVVLAQEVDVLVAAQDDLSQANLAVLLAYAETHDPLHYAEDAVFHDMTLPEPIVGREAIGAMFASIYVEGFPDADPQTTSLTAIGNRVIMEFVFRGTNTGPLFGREATGRFVEIPMMIVYDIDDGLIHEARLYYDGASYARALGWSE